MISFWRYTGTNKRTYDCEFSYSGPTLVPFDATNSKSYRKQYLMQGRSNEIFCFINEKSEDDESSEKTSLKLCTLKTQAGSSRSRNFKENVN